MAEMKKPVLEDGFQRAPMGFTLVELLVVIAIIALLSSLLVVATGSAMESARQAKCATNIRQLAIAINLAADDNGGKYPLFCSLFYAPLIPDPQIYMQPYLGMNGDVWHCPSDDGKGIDRNPSDNSITRSYSYNSNLCLGFSETATAVPKIRVGHPSSTILVCEAWVGFAVWSPNGIVGLCSYDEKGVSGVTSQLHHGKDLSNYAFVDGHIEALLWTLVCPSGNVYGNDDMFSVTPSSN
jgi:prepilin-type N-terminal cleavage/methylation domain-containing protein/prepilin-type processing-associated H-X9-DG protein